jgi:hypothetical protein
MGISSNVQSRGLPHQGARPVGRLMWGADRAAIAAGTCYSLIAGMGHESAVPAPPLQSGAFSTILVACSVKFYPQGRMKHARVVILPLRSVPAQVARAVA